MQEEREQSDATERTEGDDGPVVLEEVAEATCSHSCPELDEGSERASKRWVQVLEAGTVCFWDHTFHGQPTCQVGSPPRRPAHRRRVKFAAAPAEVAGKYDTEDGHCDEEGRGARPVRSTGRRQLTSVTPADIRLLEQELGEENRPSLDRLKRR